MRCLALLIAALLLPGCFAFEEIDKGMEIMEAHTPLVNKKKREEEVRARDASPAKPDPRVAWWKNARSLGPRSKSESETLVNCLVGGSTRFMRRDDCLTRGGSIAR